MTGSQPLRLLLVEDVQQVAQYVRGLLNAQQRLQLIDVVTDGGKALAQIQQLRPDVVIVDALLQGRVKGLRLVEQIHEGGLGIPVIVLTVPQNPVERDPAQGIAAVLTMPFSGFEMANMVVSVHGAALAANRGRQSALNVVFAPKGGVGKTTLAFNLAVAMGQLGTSTVLVDGSLQYGDLRSLLKVPVDAPSILDLPTDRIGESDLQDVLWRDPSGVDILLAPPRVEYAEMITPRDVEKVLSMLRRVYSAVVVDMAATIGDVSLALFDAADVILQIVTYDSTTIRNTLAVAEAFRAIGYPPGKVQYVVNRVDSSGGISPEDLARVLGRPPDHSVVSDGRLVVQCNNDGIPFVLANPGAQISHDVVRIATALVGEGRPAAAGSRR
jgi:pilus assembly protein CpaE